ncbi:MAG: response regulator [Nannocystaceae bacterium]|nr:response regulator [bacterium]
MGTLDSASPTTVALVDDDLDLLEATRRRIVVSLPDVEVRIYSDTTDALAALTEVSHGLAILDVDMPGMSGLELAAVLRERRPELPVVFMTGTSKQNMVQEYERVGAVAWLRKPVPGRVLIETILEHALRTPAT